MFIKTKKNNEMSERSDVNSKYTARYNYKTTQTTSKRRLKKFTSLSLTFMMVFGLIADVIPKDIFADSKDIDITNVSAPTTYQTFTNQKTGTTPSTLTLTVSVALNKAGINGATIEVPYDGFTPDPDGNTSDPDYVFKYFTQPKQANGKFEPIFSFVAQTPSSDSIVESYTNDLVNNKLVIKLKKTTTKVETLHLRFNFNDKYNAKIPPGQVVWKEPKAVAKDSNGSKISEANAADIVTTATFGMTGTFERFFPSSENYLSGHMTIRYQVHDKYNTQSQLDTSQADNNLIYVELPKEFDVESSNSNVIKRIMDYENTEFAKDKYKGTPYYNIKSFKIESGQTENGSTIIHGQDSNKIKAGHVRYYIHLVEGDTTIFPQWAYRGDIDNNFLQYEVRANNEMTGLATGTEFYIRAGAIYKKVNARQMESCSSSTASKPENNDYWRYIKQDTKDYDFYIGGTNSTGGEPCYVKMWDKSAEATHWIHNFGFNYTHAGSTRNQGEKDMTGVQFIVYQA
ncbi:MAG: hypothetical protein LBR30_05780, partial [Clostridioides sp.]|nr:hypothetical protein [Clostridioides sp.]